LGGAGTGGAGTGGAGTGGAGTGGAGTGGAGTGGDGMGGEGGAGAGGAGAAGEGTGGEGGAGAGGCGASPGSAGSSGAPSGPVVTPIAVDWSTSFEREFCEFVEVSGYCYLDGDASREIVSTPTHTGAHAAAFTVNSEAGSGQARCVRQGTLPLDAVYGAWFYVPSLADMPRLWNLMFFQGGSEDAATVKLWDVSIGAAGNGGNGLYLFDHVRGDVLRLEDAPEVPIETWFHVEFRLRRAADETGVAALYQDGLLVYETPPLATDATSWGQWFIGNLSEGRVPPDSTIYVDDVSIRAAP
jgi:hypothetical protein